MAAGQDAATIRNVRRLQEYLAGQAILAILQIGFMVALVLFARTIYAIFERHGEQWNLLYLRLSLGGTMVCFLLVGRRLVLRIREILNCRHELSEAHRKLRELRHQLRHPDDHDHGPG